MVKKSLRRPSSCVPLYLLLALHSGEDIIIMTRAALLCCDPCGRERVGVPPPPLPSTTHHAEHNLYSYAGCCTSLVLNGGDFSYGAADFLLLLLPLLLSHRVDSARPAAVVVVCCFNEGRNRPYNGWAGIIRTVVNWD